MTRADIRTFLEFVRKKTLDTLDAIAKRPDAAELLAGLTGRVGVGRALPLLALLGLVPAALANFTPPDAFPVSVAGDSFTSLAGDLRWWLLAGAVVCYQAIEASLPG